MNSSGIGDGITAALRSLGSRFLSLAANRLQLFSVELQEEKLRFLDLLLALLLSLALGAIALVMGTVCLALWLKQLFGYPGLGLAALVFMAVAVALFLVTRRKLKTGPNPFAQTITEFKKDVECLRPKD